jgi:hypothetical protein
MIKTEKKRRGRKASTTIRAIAGRPLNEDEIKQFVAHYEKNGNFPGHKIPCVVTGKLTTCVGPWMRKKIKEFGSAEALLRGYKCRGVFKAARKAATQKIKKIGKRAEKRAEKQKKLKDIPVMPTGTKRPQTNEEFTEASHRECARPDIFLDNGRHCLDCPHYAICENDIKCLPRGFKFIDGKFVETGK